MKILVLGLIVLILATNGSKAQNKTDCYFKIDEAAILVNKHLDHLLEKLQKDQFVVGRDKRRIPAYIQKQLYCLFEDTLANPAEDWQETDVIIEGLPWRKLIFFALSRDLFVMNYYHGGFGRSTHILIMEFTGSGMRANGEKRLIDVWTSQAADFNGSTIKKLTDFILKNRYKKDGLNTNMVMY